MRGAIDGEAWGLTDGWLGSSLGWVGGGGWVGSTVQGGHRDLEQLPKAQRVHAF